MLKKANLGDRIKKLFGLGIKEDELFEDIEEALVEADIGPRIAMDVIDELKLQVRKDRLKEKEEYVSVLKLILGKYLKIESVGREGNLDPTDPTTFPRASRGTSIAKLVGYVAIGITDYARFITDIDRRSVIASIGVPSVYDATNKLTTPGVLDFNGVDSVAGVCSGRAGNGPDPSGE